MGIEYDLLDTKNKRAFGLWKNWGYQIAEHLNPLIIRARAYQDLGVSYPLHTQALRDFVERQYLEDVRVPVSDRAILEERRKAIARARTVAERILRFCEEADWHVILTNDSSGDDLDDFHMQWPETGSVYDLRQA